MIQFISHHTEQITYLDSIRMALEGGCRWVQLRMKEATSQEIIRVGTEVRKMCDRYQATFIIDDHVELVQQLGADGVHLGKKDMPVAEARKILGDRFIIGGTANTFDDILLHYKASANYIGCGPFRFTTTKKGLAPILGLEGYRNIVKRMREEGINIPVIAIGGITAEDIQAVMQTGVDGVALSSAVLRSQDPVAEMQKLLLSMQAFPPVDG